MMDNDFVRQRLEQHELKLLTFEVTMVEQSFELCRDSVRVVLVVSEGVSKFSNNCSSSTMSIQVPAHVSKLKFKVQHEHKSSHTSVRVPD